VVVATRQFGVLTDADGFGLLVAYGRGDGVAGREQAVAGDGTENWRLILEAARALTAAGQSPFTRISVYEVDQHDTRLLPVRLGSGPRNRTATDGGPRRLEPPIGAANAWCWTIANAERKGRFCVTGCARPTLAQIPAVARRESD
jgi:hypothetical protein